jgi:cytochrome c oxidase subunit II
MRRIMRWSISLSMAVLTLMAGTGAAFAQEPGVGMAVPWQLGFQEAVTPSMERLVALHDLMMWIISLITLLVLVLIAIACFRFQAAKHPTPTRRTHHTALEIAWTVIPVLILVVIAIPSFRLLYFMDRVEEPDMTLKAIGRQWYWSYEYPDHGDFTFDAFMVPDEELQPGQPRLLTTDTEVVLPTDTNIRLLVTASDVLHSWAMPAFGVKKDAVPGRINETWFRIERPGVYYGQCSELCGAYHAFMPIQIRAVPVEEFEQWVEQASAQFDRAAEIDVARQEAAE